MEAFVFRHPARGGSMSSTGSPPFAFSRATATPQSKSTSTCESHETRSTGNVDTTASSSPSGGSPTSAVPLRPYRALRMYAACPCPHAIRLPQVVANTPRQHQVLSPLHQRAVLRPGDHDKRSRGTGSCVTALARKSYTNLTGRTNAHLTQDSLRLMA